MTGPMVQSGLDQSRPYRRVFAQTFAADLRGNLVQVGLHLRLLNQRASPEAPLVVEIQSVLGGEPTGQVLATESIDPKD